MDVVSGESSGNFGQLVLLYPLLFWLQVDVPACAALALIPGYAWSWSELNLDGA